MNHIQLITQLREKTAAPMAECKSALEASLWDLEKSIDIIKARNLVLADSRASKPAAEGLICIQHGTDFDAMIEVNSQTDFCARSPEFKVLAEQAIIEWAASVSASKPFVASDGLETMRKELIARTKESIVIRRWWAEQSMNAQTRVFSYLHSNGKIGVLVSLEAKSEEQVETKEFADLGEIVSMQIAAMCPIAVSIDRVSADVIERQRAIFVEQVKDKPAAQQGKIVEGKMRKWTQDSCLLDQESVLHPKKSIRDLLDGVVIGNYHRAVVGEGVEVEKTDLAAEVEAMTGVPKTVQPNYRGMSNVDCVKTIGE